MTRGICNRDIARYGQAAFGSSSSGDRGNRYDVDAFARYGLDAYARYELSHGQAELLRGSSMRSVITMCAILQCDGMGFDAVRATMLPALLYRSSARTERLPPAFRLQ